MFYVPRDLDCGKLEDEEPPTHRPLTTPSTVAHGYAPTLSCKSLEVQAGYEIALEKELVRSLVSLEERLDNLAFDEPLRRPKGMELAPYRPMGPGMSVMVERAMLAEWSLFHHFSVKGQSLPRGPACATPRLVAGAAANPTTATTTAPVAAYQVQTTTTPPTTTGPVAAYQGQTTTTPPTTTGPGPAKAPHAASSPGSPDMRVQGRRASIARTPLELCRQIRSGDGARETYYWVEAAFGGVFPVGEGAEEEEEEEKGDRGPAEHAQDVEEVVVARHPLVDDGLRALENDWPALFMTADERAQLFRNPNGEEAGRSAAAKKRPRRRGKTTAGRSAAAGAAAKVPGCQPRDEVLRCAVEAAADELFSEVVVPLLAALVPAEVVVRPPQPDPAAAAAAAAARRGSSASWSESIRGCSRASSSRLVGDGGCSSSRRALLREGLQYEDHLQQQQHQEEEDHRHQYQHQQQQQHQEEEEHRYQYQHQLRQQQQQQQQQPQEKERRYQYEQQRHQQQQRQEDEEHRYQYGQQHQQQQDQLDLEQPQQRQQLHHPPQQWQDQQQQQQWRDQQQQLGHRQLQQHQQQRPPPLQEDLQNQRQEQRLHSAEGTRSAAAQEDDSLASQQPESSRSTLDGTPAAAQPRSRCASPPPAGKDADQHRCLSAASSLYSPMGSFSADDRRERPDAGNGEAGHRTRTRPHEGPETSSTANSCGVHEQASDARGTAGSCRQRGLFAKEADAARPQQQQQQGDPEYLATGRQRLQQQQQQQQGDPEHFATGRQQQQEEEEGRSRSEAGQPDAQFPRGGPSPTSADGPDGRPGQPGASQPGAEQIRLSGKQANGSREAGVSRRVPDGAASAQRQAVGDSSNVSPSPPARRAKGSAEGRTGAEHPQPVPRRRPDKPHTAKKKKDHKDKDHKDKDHKDKDHKDKDHKDKDHNKDKDHKDKDHKDHNHKDRIPRKGAERPKPDDSTKQAAGSKQDAAVPCSSTTTAHAPRTPPAGRNSPPHPSDNPSHGGSARSSRPQENTPGNPEPENDQRPSQGSSADAGEPAGALKRNGGRAPGGAGESDGLALETEPGGDQQPEAEQKSQRRASRALNARAKGREPLNDGRDAPSYGGACVAVQQQQQQQLLLLQYAQQDCGPIQNLSLPPVDGSLSLARGAYEPALALGGVSGGTSSSSAANAPLSAPRNKHAPNCPAPSAPCHVHAAPASGKLPSSSTSSAAVVGDGARRDPAMAVNIGLSLPSILNLQQKPNPAQSMFDWPIRAQTAIPSHRALRLEQAQQYQPPQR
ncbi:hypothetical protein DIPPA_07079 [Diplonema papillatum]|nr:hypothetical protein DIPPA_07079 [Diplonema papillatum]